MYVMVAGQLRSSVTITECLPSIRVLKIADLTNNAHSEALWLTEVIHAQLKISAPWTLFKFTYKRWSISMYFYIHWERERSRDMFSHRLMKTFSWFRRVSHVHRTLNPDFVSLLGANSILGISWQVAWFVPLAIEMVGLLTGENLLVAMRQMSDQHRNSKQWLVRQWTHNYFNLLTCGVSWERCHVVVSWK